MTRALWYDPDCGFCVRSARVLQRLRLEVAVVPIPGDAELDAAGITLDQALERIHLVGEGRPLTGHRAIAASLESSRIPPVRWAGHALAARAVDKPASQGYDWIARNRHGLPGGTAACAMPTAPDDRVAR